MLIQQEHITRADLRNNGAVLYLFGDNWTRKGRGGMAKIMRGEPNAVGIITKKFPGMEPEDFLTDDELDRNVASFRADFAPVRHHLKKGGVAVVPWRGLGIGLAQLPDRAPKTFEALAEQLWELSKVAPETCLCRYDGGNAR